jgi:ankyrin repeat protein
MKFLLAKGCPVDGHDPSLGESPLHDAVFEGQVEATALLIEKGADVNSKDSGGSTAMTALIGAATSLNEKQLAAIKLLLDHKANPNLKGTQGKTPLAMASENDDKATAALLKQYGAQ